MDHLTLAPGKDSIMSMACLSWIRQFSFQPYANLANVSSSFLAERIVSMNGFGCLISCRISHIRCTSNEGRHETANEKFDFRGLWPTASYINHSCYSNVRQSFIGDMMIVVPREISRRILKSSSGTSHLLVTLNNKWTVSAGASNAPASYEGIQATDKITLVKRKGLRAEILKTFQSQTTKYIRDRLSTLTETYTKPATEIPRLTLWDLHLSPIKNIHRAKPASKRHSLGPESPKSPSAMLSTAEPPFLTNRKRARTHPN